MKTWVLLCLNNYPRGYKTRMCIKACTFFASTSRASLSLAVINHFLLFFASFLVKLSPDLRNQLVVRVQLGNPSTPDSIMYLESLRSVVDVVRAWMNWRSAMSALVWTPLRKHKTWMITWPIALIQVRIVTIAISVTEISCLGINFLWFEHVLAQKALWETWLY